MRNQAKRTRVGAIKTDTQKPDVLLVACDYADHCTFFLSASVAVASAASTNLFPVPPARK